MHVCSGAWLLHQCLKRGRGQRVARNAANGVGIPPSQRLRRGTVNDGRTEALALADPTIDKIVNLGSPQVDAGSQLCEQESCVRIASENLYRSAANGSCPCTCPTRGAPLLITKKATIIELPDRAPTRSRRTPCPPSCRTTTTPRRRRCRPSRGLFHEAMCPVFSTGLCLRTGRTPRSIALDRRRRRTPKSWDVRRAFLCFFGPHGA